MRGRMNAAKSYAAPAEIGQPMVGGTIGEIVASRHSKFAHGDMVLGFGGWQDYALVMSIRLVACGWSRFAARHRSSC
jgi:NADPH-dependent curcumin reductase CurA